MDLSDSFPSPTHGPLLPAKKPRPSPLAMGSFGYPAVQLQARGYIGEDCNDGQPSGRRVWVATDPVDRPCRSLDRPQGRLVSQDRGEFYLGDSKYRKIRKVLRGGRPRSNLCQRERRMIRACSCFFGSDCSPLSKLFTGLGRYHCTS